MSESEKASEKARKKKSNPQVWKFYRIQGNKALCIKRECPRCGKGVFLAEHADRFSCGKCGFTQFKKGR
ncbi:MAG: 30S ribosomal protein S27ae [Nitrososphaerota archaeon]|nr:30S ribosomal protein S27ae [Nitrososphaerales archaeon]MCX8191426.1 30S ribosomal protein S27ae [Nitrososphaerales archaeon]MDW8045312.1 30S ribosomal protein S27ae [Nitrososphaerota archaeon]